MMIMPPTDNRTPVVAQVFADITITLEDGGPDRWASGNLGTNFSDPDGDELSYSVGSSNESVADAVISGSGPMVIVQAQGGGTATITITARDPGGLTATQSFRVTVNDKPDHSNTPAGATAIALSESFQGRIDTPNDVDYFRLRVDSPGTLTIRTTGNADPDIAVFDGAGNGVQGVSGSWIGSITQEILDRGGDLLVRFSGGNAGGEYTGSATLDQTPQTSPDLSVGSPTVSDSSPETRGAFTLSAMVSNQGNGESATTTLRYYRSADGTITTSDTEVGTDAVAGLAASGSDSQSVELVAPSAPGTYYYGACVDAVAGESDTTNNCSIAAQVIVPVPERPDLMVVSSSVSNNSPTAGSQFTLSATVQNDGNGESAATTLRYFRSADGTITTSDTEVGTDAVAGLAASGGDSQSVELVAPSAPGPYYYGACVETVAGESDTANNCSIAVQITVLLTDTQIQGSPDLEVGTPTVSDTSPETGASFTLSATVSNAGDGESVATTLRYYRSTDATIRTSDTSVGTDAVDVLAAAGTSAQSISLTGPATAGTYYYGACVDAVTDESDTTNNCSGSVKVDVEAPKYPDLEVGTPTVSDTSPETGGSFTLSATVSNAGDGESVATTLRYYRSTDATITTLDTAVGKDAVGALAASGTSAQSISLTAPATAGAYYYGACVDAVTGESDTTDNCSGSVKVDVEAPKYPDLEVGTPTVSDTSPETGASFTLSATVSNAGDEQSAATTLRYYRSTDSTISSSDTQVGTDAVGALAASGTSAESISLTAPSTAGTYYYGACVDAVTGESDTTNNCSSSVTIAVEEESSGQPDLRIVGIIAATPLDGVGPGSLIQFSANVRNYGDANSDATTLRYYRSTDATISVSDTEVGTDEVSALVPSAQVAEGIDLHAPSTAGTYYYGACVDAVTGESDTTNNCSGSLAITVPEPEPDLVVGSPTVSDSSPASGANFTLSATVRNAGGAASSSTTLRYYRSTDATITTSDTSVGTDAVGALAAAGTSSESISLTAPSSAGTYYYGACVDAVTHESDATNNCSSSVAVTVAEPQTSPDLSVGSPTVSDSSPETGGAFTLSATVSNDGDGAAAATTLRYYRSTDATITTSDTAVGTDAVGALAASGTSAQSISLTAPATAGAYYYGACVDAVTDESDTTDNCSASVTVTVADPEPEPQPDLIVDSFTITLGPTLEPDPGALVQLNQRVANVGDAASAATTVRYYRSTDATITTSDTQVGTDAVPELAASSRFIEAQHESLPTAPGTYYYGACVDGVAGESNTVNNCSRAVKVTVPEPQPDLVVSASVDDSNLNTGDSFTLSATVSNAGDEQSAATTLRYYRSTDSTISSSDTQVGTDAVGALAASGTSAESISLTAPSTAGTYYYGACVAAVTDESDTTNNCSSSVTIAVEEESTGQPDLRIVGIIAATPLDGVGPGSLIQFSANVRNYGDANSDATTLRYYRSTDATISVSDTEIGTDEVSALVPSAQVAEGIDLHAPSTAGTYYYGACVDAVTGESDTTNNCSGSLAITVPEPEPDLVVGSPTASDRSPASGANFTLSATVRNAGGAASSSTTLRYYRSTDATITTSDTSVGTDAVGALAAAGTSSESISLTAPSSAGTYYYGACVDTVTHESDATNNCSSSVAVTVAEPQTSPDLSVGSPTVSDSSPETGGAFTLSATVSNDGDGAAAATTLRYYRSTDATITTSDTAVGTDAVGALAASETSSESISLTAPSSAGTYYYGACVDAVTDESDTTDNCSGSVTITVATPEPQPDLIVDSFTITLGPTLEPDPGALVQLNQRVANVGDAASAATTVRYYRSTDATITTSDTQVGTDAVPELAASSRFIESQHESLPTAPGTYYYGACVEAVAGESNTANNCSRSVKVTVPAPQPDLVVSASVDDSNLNTGDSFTLSATVSNAGDEQSAASTLRYYRSTDSTISSSDTQVGTDAVGALAASGTSAGSISLTAPSTAGAYYYGACVDAVTDESDTTNNCSSSVTIAVEEESSGQPDLRIVGLFAVTPLDGVFPGTRIQFSAGVWNYGDANSDATTLRYYRSTDATISVSDTEIGTDEVSALVPSGQVSVGIDLYGPSTPGTYYYGACVDAVAGESDTTNNCSGSLDFTVPEPEPDLVVGSPTVSDSSPASGANFTLSATVRNAGGAASSSTTLRYYRSTDATITTTDTALGTDAVGALAASGTSAQSISLTAPATAGAYHYGACVDTVAGESDTTDNCSGSVKVDVEAPKYPDLEVGTPTVSDTSPETGASFTLSATVSNAGDGESSSTTLRYYRSTDATITTSDTTVGTDAVGALAASGTSAQSISLATPATAGAYYYGVCVDAVTGESDTTNNCSGPVKVDVSEPPTQTSPDLTVTLDITVPSGGITAGSSLRVGATVDNSGDAASDPTTLRYYLSKDRPIRTSDTEVGTDTVEGLASRERTTKSVELTAPSTPGRYFYNACVDAVAGESNTTNNCSFVSIGMTVTSLPVPDLSVDSPSVSDDSPVTGAAFTLSATVSNTGDGESVATTLRYYRSTDATITTSDMAVGTDAVGTLAAAGTSAESISLTAPSTAGTYYYGACVAAVTDESDTTNNCSSSVTVTVAAPEPGPDLIVEYFNIILGPTLETPPGALVLLNERVANVGDAASAATTLRYYRSTDATITTSDTQVGTDAVPELAASSRFIESQHESLPTAPGTYYYGACVEAVAGESNTANNCSRSVKVTVPAPQPDLVVSASVDDSNLNTGDSFTLSATVSNAGDEQSAASTLRYYRSTDSTISSSDTQVGTDAVGALAASGTSAGSISLTAPSTAGAYYYGACVDAVTDESDTTNNCSSSVTIAVEEESSGQPDLRIVGLFAVTPDGVFPGTRIQFSAGVRNYGDANSDATTLRYYRSTDATISVSDTEVGTDEVSALVPSGQVSVGIDLYGPSTPGTYYYGACVDAVAGESDTTNNCSGALAINVN